jgi:hypothetical protein
MNIAMTSAAGGIARPRPGWLEVSRGRAFATHLAASATVVGTVCALIFWVWYPHPYFEAAGAWNVLRVLIGVDLVVGPLLTLIVFKPRKRGLALDLAVIAVVQLAALVYGLTVIYRERPYFTVFALDRFYVLARQDVGPAALNDPALTAARRIGEKPRIGPLLVVATRPSDVAGKQKLLEETVFEGKPDIERRPEFWGKYTDGADQVRSRAAPLAALAAVEPGAAAEIEHLTARLQRPENELGFLPMIAKNKDLALVVDLTDGMPLEVLDVDPWKAAADADAAALR